MKINKINANHQTIATAEALFFTSYNVFIAKIENDRVFLDAEKWNYSKTTAKYRNQFLNEDTKTTEQKIKDGIYTLTNLN